MSAFVYNPEESKRRKEQVEKSGGLLLSMDGMRKACRHILDAKNKTDIVFFFVTRLADFGVFNRDEMKMQMRIWKSQAKDGKLTTYASNNKEYDVDGKKVYSLVISPKCVPQYCPLSLAFGTMVSGWTYAFAKKENRDDVFAYVKKYCEEESK